MGVAGPAAVVRLDAFDVVASAKREVVLGAGGDGLAGCFGRSH